MNFTTNKTGYNENENDKNPACWQKSIKCIYKLQIVVVVCFFFVGGKEILSQSFSISNAVSTTNVDSNKHQIE